MGYKLFRDYKHVRRQILLLLQILTVAVALRAIMSTPASSQSLNCSEILTGRSDFTPVFDQSNHSSEELARYTQSREANLGGRDQPLIVLGQKNPLRVIGKDGQSRPWAPRDGLVIGAYNVKNLFYHLGRFFYSEAGKFTMDPNRGPRPRPDHEVDGLAKIMNRVGAHFWTLTEVEGIQALKAYLPRLLKKFFPFLYEGNDSRGIDVAALVSEELPISVEYLNNKSMLYFDPTNQNKLVPVFSRDLTAALLRTSPDRSLEPFAIVLSHHGKSQRDRPGDENSKTVRAAQSLAIKELAQQYEQAFPNAVILLVGDFNAQVRAGIPQHPVPAELGPISENFVSVFDILKIPADRTTTHAYFPKDAEPVYSQMDDIQIYRKHVDRIEVASAEVVTYLDEKGNILGKPNSYDERETKQSSDHNPIVSFIKFLK